MRERSSNSAEVRLFKLDRERILRLLRNYAKKLVEEGRAELVILFGSLARGNYTAFSDADLLIVAENVPERWLDRIPAYIDPEVPIDMEPRVFTMKELYEMARSRSRVVKEVLEDGIVLAGDRRILKDLKKL